MKALSIKQPWAWLICAGVKDIENRNWPLAAKAPIEWRVSGKMVLPQKIYVHAGKTPDFSWDTRYFIATCLAKQGKSLADHDFFTDKFGAIIGEVTITACVTESQSPWFVGPYGFVLTDPKLYDKTIPMKGRLGFWDVPDSLRKE